MKIAKIEAVKIQILRDSKNFNEIFTKNVT